MQLDVEDGQTVEKEKETPDSDADAGADILLVEDDPGRVELTLRALRDAARDGVRVAVVADGEQALAMLHDAGAKRRPRVVVLAVALPRMSGLEVLKRLRAHASTRTLPAIMFGAADDAAPSYRLGANSFVLRPSEFAQTLRVARDIAHYWLRINEAPARGA